MYIVPVKVEDGQFLRTKKFITTSLGNPLVNPILTEDMLNICIEEALSHWYNWMSEGWQYMVVDYWQFTTEADKATYELHPCVDPAKIRSVVYNPQNYSLFNIAFNQNFDFLFFTTAEQTPDLTTFYFAMMKQELVNMVLGQEGTWDIVGSPPRIHLMPTPQGILNVAVMFSKLPDEQTLEKISWVRNFALAKAKHMLGDVLSRYSTIPGGMGEIQMNGSELKQEGQQEQEKMLEELRLNTVYYSQTDYDGF